MCGIAGLFRAEGLDPSPLAAMSAALSHRGPDDHGHRVFGEARPWAALAARRLAITDPAGGHQPISDRGRRFWVVLNGEIYNHHQLYKELVANEVALTTHSDTEVVAGMLSAMPMLRAITRLEGMFALAIVDTVERRLFLVRDRLGVKPLYWTIAPDGTLVFGSELKALRAHPGLSWTMDRTALQSYLLFEYVPTPRSIWQGVHKLEPGTWLEVDAAGVRHHRWWTPPVPLDGHGGNRKRWADSVHGAVQVAVLQRMIAGVEVGYLLSGGLDSSAVVALARRKAGQAVPTFSLSVDAPGFDEGPSARAVAAALGTEHHEARFGAEHLEETLGQITASLDEPLADSSLLPTWRLMALVRQHGLKCVLSGDGADESFGGYPTLAAHRLAPVGRLAGPVLRAALARLPVSWEGLSREYMARRFVEGLGLPWARRHQVWMGAWLPEELGLGADDPVWQVVDAHAAAAEGADPASRALYLDQRLYLSDGVLVKVDRASMAHGVEVRSPFMDRTVVELAADIPIGHKLVGRDTKVVLKEAMADLLPAEVLRRPKHGFGAPIGPWLRGPCRHLLAGLPERVADLLPADRLRAAIEAHLSGQADHRRRLWTALVLAGWREGPWGDDKPASSRLL